MKGRMLAALLGLTGLCHASQGLDFAVDLRFRDRPLAFDTLAFDTSGNQTLSFTRCDLLLSGAALMREDGTWIGAENWVAFIGGRDGRNRFTLSAVPEGKYTGLRFNVGVPPALNHGDPAKFAADHPLNPSFSGMHWNWQGGYIFAALEGFWRSSGIPVGGYSFHLANDGNIAVIELPIDLDLSRARTLRLSLDLARVLDGLVITAENPATHSRDGDPFAILLRENFRRSFRVESIVETPSRNEAAAAKKALIASTATPYRFTISSSFPRPALPGDNPLTEEGVALGEHLFHDTRLSGNGRQACIQCHRPPDGFSDRRRFSIGAFGEMGSRQSMPLTNLAWKSPYFWDGRASTLREQVLMPIQDKAEMHASLPKVLRILEDDPEYPKMFEEAFGSRKIDSDRMARALEQFLLTLVSDDSKYDRARRGELELSGQEKLGESLFNTEYDPKRGLRGADCFHCHGGPLFRNVAFANNGLDSTSRDTGRMKVTKLEGDRGKFAVPSLRDVARTAPYMHDGRFASLEEVIAHYDHGLQRSSALDPNLAKHPAEGLQLTDVEKAALVAFLKTLGDVRPPRRPPPERLPPPPLFGGPPPGRR